MIQNTIMHYESSSWRRAFLSWEDKFVKDFTFRGITVSQFPSRSAFYKHKTRVFGKQRGKGKHIKASSRNINVFDRNSDFDLDVDQVPDTGFTVWDASLLLGMYSSRPKIWHRFISNLDKAPGVPITTLELGSGTGLASMLVASSKAVQQVEHSHVEMFLTDLPALIDFTHFNVEKNKQNFPNHITMNLHPLRWGNCNDLQLLPSHARFPDVVFGADLIYTQDSSVIALLVETVASLVRPGCVAVFVVCTEHRLESVHLFISLMTQVGFDVVVVSATTAHRALPATDDEFRVLECWRK